MVLVTVARAALGARCALSVVAVAYKPLLALVALGHLAAAKAAVDALGTRGGKGAAEVI